MAGRKVELERSLEDRCVERVEALGGRALKLRIEGVRGFQDRTVMLPGGIIFFVEFKRAKGGRTALQQDHWHQTLTDLGQRAYFVNDDEDFETILITERRYSR